MPMIRIAQILILIALTGCAMSPSSGISGPTGRASDAGKVTVISVRDVWKQDLKGTSQDLVAKKLELGKTAKFDGNVRYDGYYDSARDVTRVGVYGNVTTTTDYGTVRNNGYYVIWEENGRITGDFPPPWQLVDVEITDVQY